MEGALVVVQETVAGIQRSNYFIVVVYNDTTVLLQTTNEKNLDLVNIGIVVVDKDEDLGTSIVHEVGMVPVEGI